MRSLAGEEVEILTESPLTPHSTLGPYRHADYLRLPDEPRCELIYGRFYLLSSPIVLHQVLVLLLSRRLDEIARLAGGLALVAPLDVLLADHSTVQPDVLYLSAESLGRARRWIEGPPDLVVEVLSPSTARRDMGEKLRLYAETGVREYWIANAAFRGFEFLVNRGGRFEVVLPAEGVYRSPLIPELVLDLVELWGEIDRRLPGLLPPTDPADPGGPGDPGG